MSTLKLGTIATQDGTESTDVTNVVNGTAKAWVNFNGTGTVAIRRGFNVSSITDNSTGNYTVNFTTAMADVDYAALITGEQVTIFGPVSSTTSAYRLDSYVPATSAVVDRSIICVTIFS
jgi:hypothetical protein